MQVRPAVLALIAATTMAGQVDVRVEHGQVKIRAKSARLHEVLDQLAARTGTNVVYDGPRPTQLVDLQLEGMPMAQAVPRIFEGLDVQYAFSADGSRAGIAMLIVTTRGSSRGPAVRPQPAPTLPVAGEPELMPEEALAPEPVPEPEEISPPALPEAASYPVFPWIASYPPPS